MVFSLCLPAASHFLSTFFSYRPLTVSDEAFFKRISHENRTTRGARPLQSRFFDRMLSSRQRTPVLFIAIPEVSILIIKNVEIIYLNADCVFSNRVFQHFSTFKIDNLGSSERRYPVLLYKEVSSLTSDRENRGLFLALALFVKTKKTFSLDI